MNVRIIGVAAAVVGGMVALLLAVHGPTDAGLNLTLRATAWTSLALFVAAIAASSIHRLWGGPAGKWLLRNRRSLGVAFAISHFIHLGLIAARASSHASAFWEGRTPQSLIPGALAYAFIVAMTVTSFEAPTRWLGRRRWKILHKAGVYVIWLVFVGGFASRASWDPTAWLGVAVLVAAMAVRVAGRRVRR